MDYTRNEDKLCNTGRPVGARYNHIYQVQEADESTELEEPVTVDEIKAYLRLEGFTPNDDSPGEDFDYDNTLIEELITEARIWVEKYTGVSLVPKLLTVWLLNQAGNIEIPGPVTSAIVITKENSDVVPADSYKFMGTDFPQLITIFNDRLQLDYAAGYTVATIPKGLKTAIKSYVAYAYEHRGEEIEDKALTESAARKARAYRRLNLFG